MRDLPLPLLLVLVTLLVLLSQYLMDTEAADEGDEENGPDHGDRASQRWMLRYLSEYRRYKDRILCETAPERRKTPTG